MPGYPAAAASMIPSHVEWGEGFLASDGSDGPTIERAESRAPWPTWPPTSGWRRPWLLTTESEAPRPAATPSQAHAAASKRENWNKIVLASVLQESLMQLPSLSICGKRLSYSENCKKNWHLHYCHESAEPNLCCMPGIDAPATIPPQSAHLVRFNRNRSLSWPTWPD